MMPLLTADAVTGTFSGLHEGDICVPIPPDGLEERLRGAGFSQAEVEVNEYAMRFRART